MARLPPIYILEGSWWGTSEVPQILPFFQALVTALGPARLSHRTVRSGDDIGYWIRAIPKGSRAFVYVACHGSGGSIHPGADEASTVSKDELVELLRANAKPQAIDFLHLGCCETVEEGKRRQTLEEIVDAAGARWASGYTKAVDWLPSTLLDMSMAAELFIPFHLDANGKSGKGNAPHLVKRAKNFVQDHNQLVRKLGFSALTRNSAGGTALLPAKLH